MTSEQQTRKNILTEAAITARYPQSNNYIFIKMLDRTLSTQHTLVYCKLLIKKNFIS